jgi:hypothetical protein
VRVVTLLAVLGLVAPARAADPTPKPKAGKAKKVKRRGPYGASSRVERPAEARGQASLRVRSIDLPRRAVVVEVVGFPRAPAGNLFTFTDDRGRKFIAVDARCEEPFPSGARVCDLETPVGYERHAWVAIELHLHGLQSSTVAAPPEEVARAFEAARALDEGGRPDGGEPTPSKAEAEEPAASPEPPTRTPTPPKREEQETEE